MELVKESLYEKFTEDSDPITDMGIGIFAKIPKIGDMSVQSFDLKDISKTICDAYSLPIKNYTPVDEKSNFQWLKGFQDQWVTMNLEIDKFIIKKFLGLKYYKYISTLLGEDYIPPMRLGISSFQKHWISQKGGEYEFAGNTLYVFIDAGGYYIPINFATSKNISNWIPNYIKNLVIKQAIWDLRYKTPIFRKNIPMPYPQRSRDNYKVNIKDFCNKYGQKNLEDLMHKNYMWNTSVENWKITDGILEFIN
jgi:hypothetical protein